MEEIKTINNVVVSLDKDTFVIAGFHQTNLNINAFMEEMKTMGGKLSRESDTFSIKGVSRKRLYSCIVAYFGKSHSMSANQRKWRDKIVDEFYDSKDMLFKKDKDGIFIVDPYQLHGTINELKSDLVGLGVTVSKVINKKRIYIELPSGVILSPSKKNKSTKKKSTKKNKAVLDNKNLVAGDIIKYIGEGFDGFSKFNPNAKFLEYTDSNDAMIEYKKKKVMVAVCHITRKK